MKVGSWCNRTRLIFGSSIHRKFIHRPDICGAPKTCFSSAAHAKYPYLYRNQNDENSNAAFYLRTLPQYKDTFFVCKTWAEGGSCHSVIIKLIEASKNAVSSDHPISSPTNAHLVDEILSSLNSLKDEELQEVLYRLSLFPPCPSWSEPIFKKCWTVLDEECVRRMGRWSLDYQFSMTDLWCRLKLIRFSKFYKILLNECLRKCHRLRKEHLIRVLFCINVERTLNPKDAIDVELQLGEIASSLHWYEVVIIAMAYFKTEKGLRNVRLFEKLLNVVIAQKDKVDSIGVAAIAKFARFNSQFESMELLGRLQREFLSELDRLSLQAATHLALIGTKSHNPCMKLVNAVVKKFECQVEEGRLKELERIALVVSVTDADCDDLGALIVDQLRDPGRQKEMEEYGRCLPSILYYLSVKEIFPHDLIDRVLSREFRTAFYGKNTEMYQRELLCLDFCAELEIVGYSGSRLEKETREHLLKCHMKRVQSQTKGRITAFEQSLKKVANLLESTFGGAEFVRICDILPQHQSNKIVFCTKNKELAKVPSRYCSLPDFQIKFLSDDIKTDLTFHVLYICGRNDFFVAENRFSGVVKLQFRQMSKMGYVVHIVHPFGAGVFASVYKLLQSLEVKLG